MQIHDSYSTAVKDKVKSTDAHVDLDKTITLAICT